MATTDDYDVYRRSGGERVSCCCGVFWGLSYSPAVSVICDGRQSSAKCRRRSYSRRVAPEYACSSRDDEHCGMYEESKCSRSQKPTSKKAIAGSGSRLLMSKAKQNSRI
jgi:hypothetical protein